MNYFKKWQKGEPILDDLKRKFVDKVEGIQRKDSDSNSDDTPPPKNNKNRAQSTKMATDKPRPNQ
jgi:hypothetical protein